MKSVMLGYDSASILPVLGTMNLIINLCFHRVAVFAILQVKSVAGRNENSGETISDFRQRVSFPS